MDSAIHVWIEVDGTPARVLDKTLQGSNSASCFVEAKDSQKFKVVFADHRTAGPKQSYALEVLVDGNRVGSKVVENHNPLFFSNQNSQDRIFSFSSNQQTKVPLSFANCDESYGTVAIKYHRVKIIEEEMKGRGRRVSSTSSSEYVDMADQPYLSFEFKYASRTYLDGHKLSSTSPRSLVRRNPAPPASSSSSTPSSVYSPRQRAPLSRLPPKRPQQVITASPTPRRQPSTFARESTTQRLSTPIPRQSADHEERKSPIDQQPLSCDSVASPSTTPYSFSPSPAVQVDPESEEGDSDDECESLKRKIASLKRQEEIAALEDEVREKEKKRKLRLKTGEEERASKKIKLELDD